ncbi:MAG: diguanylate cyclase domain-containing protein [Bacillota bacterium]
MTLIQAIILISFGFLSLVPTLRLFHYKQHRKYENLRYFVTVVFLWTLIQFIFYLIDNVTFIYFIKFLTYPIIFLIVYLGYETIQSFIGKNTPKWFRMIGITYFIFSLVVTLTNPIHMEFLKLSIDNVTSHNDFLHADIGLWFIIHMTVSYILVIFVMIKLIVHLRKPAQYNRSIFPFYSIIIILGLGIVINFIHIVFYTLSLDPTYLFIVLMSYALYWIVFRRDFQFQLLASNRNVLINAMREMYIIADKYGNVIEYSNKLLTSFEIKDEETQLLSAFIHALKKQAILYKTFDHVKDAPFIDKPYLYTIYKEFTFDQFNQQGTLVLLYDETRLMKLVDQLNYYIKYDQMTDCYNRNYFETQQENLIKTYPNYGIIMTDLNGLKLHNDYLGHAAGDDLIKRFVNNTKKITADNSLMFRMGGDEFLILVKNTQKTSLEALKDAIIYINSDNDIENHISVAVGTAKHKNDEHIEDTIKRADQASYDMKKTYSSEYQKKLIAYLNKTKK